MSCRGWPGGIVVMFVCPLWQPGFVGSAWVWTDTPLINPCHGDIQNRGRLTQMLPQQQSFSSKKRKIGNRCWIRANLSRPPPPKKKSSRSGERKSDLSYHSRESQTLKKFPDLSQFTEPEPLKEGKTRSLEKGPCCTAKNVYCKYSPEGFVAIYIVTVVWGRGNKQTFRCHWKLSVN